MPKKSHISVISGLWIVIVLFFLTFQDIEFTQLEFDFGAMLQLVGLFVLLWVMFTLMCALILYGLDTFVKTDLQRRNKQRRK